MIRKFAGDFFSANLEAIVLWTLASRSLNKTNKVVSSWSKFFIKLSISLTTIRSCLARRVGTHQVDAVALTAAVYFVSIINRVRLVPRGMLSKTSMNDVKYSASNLPLFIHAIGRGKTGSYLWCSMFCGRFSGLLRRAMWPVIQSDEGGTKLLPASPD